MLRRPTTAALLAAALLAAACSNGSPTGPGTPAPSIAIASITPAIGSTLGGTAVTIIGSGFTAGSAVTIGGVGATSVIVQSSAAITAVAPAGAAGPADVVVSLGTSSARLNGGFTYVVPSNGPNAPPTVGSIAAQGPRPNQPAGMADVGESITLSVSVTDTETAPASMRYTWSATAGTISGDGRSLTWTAPATVSSPLVVTITLTVVETYVQIVNGQPMSGEHRIERSRTIRVHDSSAEVLALARQFLLDFSDSSIPPATVIQNFSDTCGGKQAELDDVEKNRCNYTITSFEVGTGMPVINFGGTCSPIPIGGDACVLIPVRWVSLTKANAPACPVYEGEPPGSTTVAEGLDLVSAVYDTGQWRLCDSRFVSNTAAGQRFKR